MCFTFSKHRRYKCKMSFVESNSGSENFWHRNLSSNILATWRCLAQVQQPIWQLVFEYATSKHPKKNSPEYIGWLSIKISWFILTPTGCCNRSNTSIQKWQIQCRKTHDLSSSAPIQFLSGLQIHRDMRHCIGNHPAWIERREASGTRVREIILHPLQKIHVVFVVFQPSCLGKRGNKKGIRILCCSVWEMGQGLAFVRR